MPDPLQRYLLGGLLQSAIRFEEASAAYYREARGRVPAGRPRELVDRLIAEEESHRERLQALAAAEHPEELMLAPEVADLPVPAAPADGGSVPTGSDLGAVAEGARERERAAYAFYHALAEQAAEPVAGQVFRHLASQEQAHLRAIDDLEALVAGD
jgi:rubrerythrin